MDIDRELRELQKTRPELNALARGTRDRDLYEFGFTYPGWYVHIMTHDGQDQVLESYKGHGATLDAAWTMARAQMLMGVH